LLPAVVAAAPVAVVVVEGAVRSEGNENAIDENVTSAVLSSLPELLFNSTRLHPHAKATKIIVEQKTKVAMNQRCLKDIV
jgi:hypothetical protein